MSTSQHPSFTVDVPSGQPPVQILGQGNVVVVVGIAVGQHPPGHPTVVVVVPGMHIGRKQMTGVFGGAEQALSNAVTVLVGHGAGVTTVRVLKPRVNSRSNTVVVMSGQGVMEGLSLEQEAVGRERGTGSEMTGWTRLSSHWVSVALFTRSNETVARGRRRKRKSGNRQGAKIYRVHIECISNRT